MLLNGGAMSPLDPGSQGPGYYKVAHANPSTVLTVTFSDRNYTTMGTCPANNTIRLRGPVGSGEFCVDNMTFVSPSNAYTPTTVTTDGSGNATITVGATLHTLSGATADAPGRYTGTFAIMVSY
jgi:hypothetical protein